MAQQLSPQERDVVREQNEAELVADAADPQLTQVFEVVDPAMPNLAHSLAQLGPRTTTHGTGNVAPPSFGEWVGKWAAEHIPQAEAKAVQYGSNSLAKKGHRFAAAVGQRVNQGQALELGVAQYTAEKADRIEDAILRGQLPTEDTWVDVAIYALMAQYIRQYGRWA